MKTGFRFGSGYVFTLSSRRLNIGGASRRYASVRSAPCRGDHPLRILGRQLTRGVQPCQVVGSQVHLNFMAIITFEGAIPRLSESRKYIPTPSDRRSASPAHFVERGLLRTVVSRFLPLSPQRIYSPIHVLRLKIRDFEPKKHIMNPIGLGQNAVCTGR